MEVKKCPVCSTLNLSDAIVCRHCRFVLQFEEESKINTTSNVTNSISYSTNSLDKSNFSFSEFIIKTIIAIILLGISFCIAFMLDLKIGTSVIAAAAVGIYKIYKM